jgi:hypothetical protein
MSGPPALSTPCTWKMSFATSNPTVVQCIWTASFGMAHCTVRHLGTAMPNAGALHPIRSGHLVYSHDDHSSKRALGVRNVLILPRSRPRRGCRKAKSIEARQAQAAQRPSRTDDPVAMPRHLAGSVASVDHEVRGRNHGLVVNAVVVGHDQDGIKCGDCRGLQRD